MNPEKVAQGYTVSQQGYQNELADRFKGAIEKCEEYCSTPCSDKLLEPSPADSPKIDKVYYQSMVMSLLYLARLTRADILFPTVYLATKSKDPTVADYDKLTRVLKFVCSRPTQGLLFKKTADLCPRLYADASHGVHLDGRGHIGVFITLGSAYIHARTCKIKLVTLSSTESEGVALCEASTYARWLKAQLSDFGYVQSVGMELHMDNTAAIHLAGHDGSFQRTKHVIIKRNYTREAIADKVRPTRCQLTCSRSLLSPRPGWTPS